MSDLLATPYFGYIASAYAVTIAVLLGVTVHLIWQSRRRKRTLKSLEDAGQVRAAADG